MALNIVWTMTGKTYSPFNLKASRVSHAISRPVNANPLPSASAGTAGQIFVLDLGQCVHTITVEGLVDSVADIPNHIPSKAQLEIAWETWYVQYGIGSTTNSSSTLTLESGMVYNVYPKSAFFTKNAAQETWWDMTLEFIVQYPIP
jgi:hypothetical protein